MVWDPKMPQTLPYRWGWGGCMLWFFLSCPVYLWSLVTSPFHSPKCPDEEDRLISLDFWGRGCELIGLGWACSKQHRKPAEGDIVPVRLMMAAWVSTVSNFPRKAGNLGFYIKSSYCFLTNFIFF